MSREDTTGRVNGPVLLMQAQLGEIREEIARLRAIEVERSAAWAEDFAASAERALRHSDRIRQLERTVTVLERLEKDMGALETVSQDLQRWRWEVRGAGFTLSGLGGVVSGLIVVIAQWLLTR
jgi:hypothetical protein